MLKIVKFSIRNKRIKSLSLSKLSLFSTKISTPDEIIDECIRLRSNMQPLNDKFKGPLDKAAQKNTILPFVFLLGNHSSGKSSFVNYVCQRKVQTAGVAPTDDSFTIIVSGPADVDRDGPAFIGDPDMGFSGLRSFGPQLIHHTQLKVRSGLAAKNFMVVDSPGMIDSPMVRDSAGIPRQAVMDRGYDFEGVCRWYAERADVILLFFDPDKPGTTGETLSILTNSLVGLDHKLHIILNKADQFRKIHDFARAYGSLCWNLSKVIQRKDLPRIYTMCLPTALQTRSSGDQSEEGRSLGQGLIDLEATREEVVLEVLNAPKRRVDNEISRLSDSVSILQMHCKIVEDLSSRYNRMVFHNRLRLGATSSIAIALPGLCFYLGLPIEAMIASGGIGVISNAGLLYWQSKMSVEFAKELITESSLESVFKRLYSRKISEKDEFTSSLWIRVKDHLKLILSTNEIMNLPKMTSQEINQLEKLSETSIPDLRRTAGPSFQRTL
jgi:hypothetical protein